MQVFSPYYRNDKLNPITPFIISVLVSAFLFYIDEGYYNFNWIYEPWNLVVFAIYIAGFVLGQCIVASFLFRKLKSWNAVVVGITGLLFGFLIVLMMLAMMPLVKLFM